MQEKNLILALQQHDAEAFKAVVAEYSDDLIIFAFLILRNREKSSELVCHVLFNLFDDGFPNANVPIHSFLYQEVRQACYILLNDIIPGYILGSTETAQLCLACEYN